MMVPRGSNYCNKESLERIERMVTLGHEAKNGLSVLSASSNYTGKMKDTST